MDQRQIEALTSLAPPAASLLRTFVVQRKKMDAMREQKELELETIKAKQKASDAPPDAMNAVAQVGQQNQEPVNDTGSNLPQTQGRGSFIDSLDELKRDEDCDLCLQILDAMETVEEGRRATALAEYGRFKQATEGTDDPSEAAAMLRDTNVLSDLIGEIHR